MMTAVRRALMAVLLVAACDPPPPQNVGAATPVLVEDDPMKADKKKFPRTELASGYERAQRDECGARCAYIREGSGRLRLDLRDDGVAIVVDEGAFRETFKAHKTRTEQKIEWKRGWRGK